MTDDQRIYEPAKREYLPEEILAFQAELSRKYRESLVLEQNLTETKRTMTAELKTIAAELAQLSDQIDKGYEYVDTEMVVLMDQPGPGQKTYIRVDNNTKHRTEPMTPADRQRSFFEEPKEE